MKGQLLGVVSACLLCAFCAPAGAVTIDYSNTVGSTINFNPLNGCGGGVVGCFDFSPDSPSTSINITSGTASGFLGNIDGTFGVGAIDISLSPLETASVSGTGTLTIIDGSNTLMADLVWIDIFSVGVAGGTNVGGTANLSNITYGGSNPDLLALLNGGSGIQTMTYQFATPHSLTQLFTTSTTVMSTSFSGNITPVPVPAAVWLFGSGLLGLVGIARRRKA